MWQIFHSKNIPIMYGPDASNLEGFLDTNIVNEVMKFSGVSSPFRKRDLKKISVDFFNTLLLVTFK